ncbi:hypothetical protein EV421DRAFT_1737432 [Armillaria borealis]|uniref:Uncharacterized protein n=1 Tax=Armillaria borealis TaxID=47425 RepID=A0AA39JCY4_9AGAR|nr:hypothetical protein EV421DRAFT_1737432 [Armillaria borealis]
MGSPYSGWTGGQAQNAQDTGNRMPHYPGHLKHTFPNPQCSSHCRIHRDTEWESYLGPRVQEGRERRPYVSLYTSSPMLICIDHTRNLALGHASPMFDLEPFTIPLFFSFMLFSFTVSLGIASLSRKVVWSSLDLALWLKIPSLYWMRSEWDPNPLLQTGPETLRPPLASKPAPDHKISCILIGRPA